MKKLFFTALLLVCFGATQAQTKEGFGFKFGLNYNANGDYFESVSENSKSPNRNIGYHLGIFGKIGNKVYLKPELIYTKTKSDYDSSAFDMKKLDLPVLVGIKVLGPVSVFGGPAFQYILDTDFEGITIDDVENDFSVGLNFGIALNFNSIGLDLRYERGLSENEATFVDNNGLINPGRLDTRPDQLILSLSIAL